MQSFDDKAHFFGDSPIGVNCFCRMDFSGRGDLSPEIKDLVYTPNGMAWKSFELIADWSVREPSLSEALSYPMFLKEEIEFGVLVECVTPYTYGDWVSEVLMTLVKHLPLRGPLLLPRCWYEKSYVIRDLNFLGVPFYCVKDSIRVKQAICLLKERPSHYFLEEEIKIYRRAFRVTGAKPASHSLIYLSRKNVLGDAYRRVYPSSELEELVMRLGGTVVDTSLATLDDYKSLIYRADVVVADFGSAILNMLYWNASRLIVVYSPDWIDMAPFFLAKGLHLCDIRTVDYTRYEMNLFLKEVECHIQDGK